MVDVKSITRDGERLVSGEHLEVGRERAAGVAAVPLVGRGRVRGHCSSWIPSSLGPERPADQLDLDRDRPALGLDHGRDVHDPPGEPGAVGRDTVLGVVTRGGVGVPGG